jgi:hypothetical protein
MFLDHVALARMAGRDREGCAVVTDALVLRGRQLDRFTKPTSSHSQRYGTRSSGGLSSRSAALIRSFASRNDASFSARFSSFPVATSRSRPPADVRVHIGLGSTP